MRKVLPLWISIPLVWLAVGIALGIHATAGEYQMINGALKYVADFSKWALIK